MAGEAAPGSRRPDHVLPVVWYRPDMRRFLAIRTSLVSTACSIDTACLNMVIAARTEPVADPK
jgi:hypothetical protein